MEETTGPTIETPLGVLKLEAVLGKATVELVELTRVPPTSFQRAEWTSRAFRVSFRMGTLDSGLLIDPDLLPGQFVEVCYGVLWRVEALQDLADEERLLFLCFWLDPGPSILSQTAGYDYGATVDAWHWQGGGIDVCVGTGNETDLAYLGQNEWFSLPKRWSSASSEGEPLLTGIEPTQLSERGLQVSDPALHAGEVCHAHVAVAWKHVVIREGSGPDGDTWMAVDLAPTRTVRAVSPHLSGT